jgi:hypothetical protein
MTRRRAAWLISLPLAVASWLGAHCLAYWLVSPGGESEMAFHAERGHTYLGYMPAIAVWWLTLVLAGLLLCVGEGVRGSRPARPPFRLFAILPPIGFTAQEYLERLIASGAVPLDLVLKPAFLVGLALQLPFALGALLLAYALRELGFGLGRAVARELALRRPFRYYAPHSVLPLPPGETPPAASVLALGHGPRAPPAAAGR